MKKRIFIFEFVSGGGFNRVNIPISLFCEGFGMLNSIIKDFKSIGFELSTLLDYRIDYLSTILAIDNYKIIKRKDNYLKQFKVFVKECDYTFIIAPESTNILYNLTNIVKNYNKTLLSTNLEGIEIGTSKIKTYNFFRKNKITTPKTYLIPLKNHNLDLEFIFQKFQELKKPIIIKPEDGVGAESIYLFETESQIENFFQDFKYKIESGRNYILQEFIKGIDLSVSLVKPATSVDSNSNSPFILSINSQNITIKSPNYESEYFGGSTPIENHEKTSIELSKLLEQIDFSQFSGYFGIDLIRGEDSRFYFIEINPRLTTSYIGLRNILNCNPTKLILESKLNGLEPKGVKLKHHSLFRRIELVYFKSKLNNKNKEKLTQRLINLIPELVTPPISLSKSNKYTCFIATKTESLTSSEQRMQEIKQLFEDLNFKIIK
ncbi:MAG: ATP-grasp domain-containing protein [Candidatus Thorarchaeota archaeon]